jgi:MFS family permease
LNQFGNPNAALLGFLISSYEVGATFGALFTFSLGDRYGRKPCNIGGSVIVLLGAVIQSSSFSVAQVSNVMGKTLTMSETIADPPAHYF